MMRFISGLLLSGLVTSSAFAMHVNVTLANDIIDNKDKISFGYVMYGTAGRTALTVDGLPQDKFIVILNGFNAAFASAVPMKGPKGELSTLSFGYSKADGTNVQPASCQNIQATTNMNVVLSETGCL